MALRLAMLKHAEASSSPILGLRRWVHSIALPMPLDGPVSQRTTPKHLVFPEIDGRLDKNTDNVSGIGFPSFSFSGSMELMTEPKRKTTPHKRGIRNGPKALKPVPVIIRCKSCGKVKLPHFYCCSGNRGATVPRTHIDDEHANALERDPKILLTTSRDPSASLIQFVKELKFVFPNAERMNRGNQVISEIIESCRAHDFTDVILVHEHRGVPDDLIISHLPFGPTAYFGLLNVVTRHDIKDKKNIGTMPEAYPHLILNNFTTKLGERTANILKHLFPVPKPDTKRIITFANQSDYISFRHHIYEKEIGPRIELRLYQIKLGPMDQNEARIEWVIRPYMNTTKKRKFIGD